MDLLLARNYRVPSGSYYTTTTFDVRTVGTVFLVLEDPTPIFSDLYDILLMYHKNRGCAKWGRRIGRQSLKEGWYVRVYVLLI